MISWPLVFRSRGHTRPGAFSPKRTLDHHSNSRMRFTISATVHIAIARPAAVSEHNFAKQQTDQEFQRHDRNYSASHLLDNYFRLIISLSGRGAN